MDRIQEIKNKIHEIMIKEGKELSDICNDVGMNWNTLDGFLRKNKKSSMDTVSRLYKYIESREK
jgi:DNA-binding phage protein